ncbi:MAG TPA: hypothetical protein VF171_04825, partial [Trueperaceae bacterium]
TPSYSQPSCRNRDGTWGVCVTSSIIMSGWQRERSPSWSARDGMVAAWHEEPRFHLAVSRG